MGIRAVIFDLGGVVIDSPLHAIGRYEHELGIPANFVNQVVMDTGPRGAWSRLERGELSMARFQEDFEAECRQAGHEISAATMMERIGECGPRPRVIKAIRTLKEAGFRTAALTNNWANDDADRDGSELRELFDEFVESSVTGLRKPDPRIYRHALAALGVEACEAVFLDDIGRNLKTARQLGMTTIKVDDPDTALRELSAAVGLTL